MAGRLDTDSLLLLHDALARLEQGFSHLPPLEPDVGNPEALRRVLNEVAERLRDNYPYFHPQYAGQMLKPPHAVARLAYALSMWINPNNHALDGGRASSAMEKEAVAELARMFGWDAHLGHLTSGGTMANLEALWIAGELKPGATVVASAQAHYTHSRISAVLKLPFESIPADGQGRMDTGRARESACKPATSARSSRRSAPPRSVPWIRCPRSCDCANATAFACTPTAPTAATTCSPTTSRRPRARRSTGLPTSTRS